MKRFILATILALATTASGNAQCYTGHSYGTRVAVAPYVNTNSHYNTAFAYPVAFNTYQVQTPYSPYSTVDLSTLAALQQYATVAAIQRQTLLNAAAYATPAPTLQPQASANQGFTKAQIEQIAAVVDAIVNNKQPEPQAPQPGAKGVKVPMEGAYKPPTLNITEGDLASVNNPALVAGVRQPVRNAAVIAANAARFGLGVGFRTLPRVGLGGYGFAVGVPRYRVPVAFGVPFSAGYGGGCQTAAVSAAFSYGTVGYAVPSVSAGGCGCNGVDAVALARLRQQAAVNAAFRTAAVGY